MVRASRIGSCPAGTRRQLDLRVKTCRVTAPHERRYAPARSGRRSRYRDFRTCSSACSLSYIGTWMQNFALPAYIDDRTESAALGRAVGVRPARAAAAAVAPRRRARRPVPPEALADRHAGRADRPHRRARRARRHDARCGRSYGAARVIGIANALNAPGVPGSIPLLVDRADLPGAISLNSVMHQRQPGPRPGARGRARRARGHGRPGLPRQRRHVPVRHRRAARRAHPRRPRRPPERGLATAAHRARIARRRAVVSRSLLAMACSRCSACRSSGCSRRSPGSTSGIDAERLDVQVAVRDVGPRRLPRRARVGTFLSRIDRRQLVSIGFAASRSASARSRSSARPGPAFPVGFAARLLLLHDRDRA